ncbi:MAG: DUF202 domain-containing protein [Cyanobacteria bacterium]|jgi:putative membrane protein|nr:DUF202 domain-containing protein [Cyanobacteria bacterium GSL.Bin1]
MNQESSNDRQREHQANERTFLAWLRTAVALIALGLATARFGLFLREIESAIAQEFSLEGPNFNSPTLGLSLVIFGLIVISLAAWRYQQVFWQIEKGKYKPSQRLVWLMVVAVMILATLSTIPLLLSSF